MNMIKKIVNECFALLFFDCKLVLIILSLFSQASMLCDGRVILAIPVTTDSEKAVSVKLFYKGDCFESLVSRKIGDQINITEKSVGHQFTVVVSDNFEVVKQRSDRFGIRGIRVPEDAVADCYNLLLSIVCDKDGKVTYKWNIEKVEVP